MENLEAVRRGPLPEGEMQFPREDGDCMHQNAGRLM